MAISTTWSDTLIWTSLCEGVLKQELYSSSINARKQLRNRIEAAVHQISSGQCLTATRVVRATLALLQKANILNNIYIKQVNKYNMNK